MSICVSEREVLENSIMMELVIEVSDFKKKTQAISSFSLDSIVWQVINLHMGSYLPFLFYHRSYSKTQFVEANYSSSLGKFWGKITKLGIRFNVKFVITNFSHSVPWIIPVFFTFWNNYFILFLFSQINSHIFHPHSCNCCFFSWFLILYSAIYYFLHSGRWSPSRTFVL